MHTPLSYPSQQNSPHWLMSLHLLPSYTKIKRIHQAFIFKMNIIFNVQTIMLWKVVMEDIKKKLRMEKIHCFKREKNCTWPPFWYDTGIQYITITCLTVTYDIQHKGMHTHNTRKYLHIYSHNTRKSKWYISTIAKLTEGFWIVLHSIGIFLAVR